MFGQVRAFRVHVVPERTKTKAIFKNLMWRYFILQPENKRGGNNMMTVNGVKCWFLCKRTKKKKERKNI